jgi:hypothetical protein
MRDVVILTFAGAVVGLAIGFWLPAPADDGLLWSAAGGATAYGLFGLCGHSFRRLHGRPFGWALGGSVGLTIGGAVWMAALAPPSDERPWALVGGFTGLFAGSICGPLLGGVALYRDIKAGRCTESAEIIGTTVMLLAVVIVFAGAAALAVASAARVLP